MTLRERLDYWPDCIVPKCPRKCCLRLNSPKCYPHTLGLNEQSAAMLLAAAIEDAPASLDHEGMGNG